MKQKEWDFNDVSEGNSVLNILLNDEVIESYNIPANSEGGGFSDTFTLDGIDYVIGASTYDTGTYAVVTTEADDSYIYEIELVINELTENVLSINYYVPTAPYTATLSSALYGLSDDSTVPMLDIENEKKFEDYLNDDLIDFRHYLDLSSVKYVVNQSEREEAKQKRKEEKKEFKRMITPLPSSEEELLSLENRILKYEMIEKNEIVIPVYLWDEFGNVEDLKVFIVELERQGYTKFALRLLSKTSFLANIDAIKEIHDFTIFMDLNTNFNVSNIKSYLDSIFFHFKTIIYLGAHFLPTQMTISGDDLNENIIRTNFPIEVFQELIKQFPTLKYGDYCGFDRKTLSSMPKGGRPSARVVLSSLDKSKKVLIRRGWDDQDESITQSGERKVGMIHSMHRLLCDIKKGVLDKEPRISGDLFMDETICDADDALKSYCPDRTTPGEVKTLCIRHNIFSVIHNYISS
ncbi:hypothetical protein [Sulfurovum sp.]|uniref:hypothetical protein n=1 Tax=Sulfurovum sp. TaxID=1969726 RepID=UPI003564A557